jgi:hypothetical protein
VENWKTIIDESGLEAVKRLGVERSAQRPRQFVFLSDFDDNIKSL